MTPEMKICGLTRPEEAQMLNRAGADYAGFVFFPKSRRNVSFAQASEIRKKLNQDIKAVAVCVSPRKELLEQIEKAGFDMIQIHGELKPEILEQASLPIWRACNLEQPEELKNIEQHEKITGYVVDAKTAGSGRTFDWEKSREALQAARENCFQGKKFILAGGLNPENVAEGITLFAPDVVDVSSGVEGAEGKEEILVQIFAGRVKHYE